MAVTQIDGARQVKDETITNTQISPTAAIALSKLAEAVIQADGGQAFTADQSMGGNQLTNVGDPLADQDAATRAWVLAQLAGVSTAGHTVRAASTGNLTLSGTQTVDGVSLSANDLVLVKNQSTASQNGIYTVSGGAWTRAPGMNAWAEVPGAIVSVQEGTVNADTLWLSTADLGGTLDTTSITFTQLPSPTDILAGAGLTRTGQTIDVVAANGSIVVNANSIEVGYATPSLTLGTSNSAGSAATSIRSDATILAFDATVPTTIAFGASAATGSATVAARRDHTHGAPANPVSYATPALTLGTANAAGSATTLIRSDATILVFDTTVPTTSTPGNAAAAGSAAVAARRDHTHGRESWAVRETPSGSVNGSNTTFTLANTPTAGTEEVYLNGILQEPGAGNDYTISGATITYLAAPLTGDKIRVNYRY